MRISAPIASLFLAYAIYVLTNAVFVAFQFVQRAFSLHAKCDLNPKFGRNVYQRVK